MAIREQVKEEMVVDLPQGPNLSAEPMVQQKEGEYNEAFDGMMAAASPQGDFGSNAVNRLSQSVNAVLQLFGPEAKEIPFVEGDVDRLSAQLTAAIAMISQAATDAGLERFAVDLGSITDDRSLEMAAGKLDALAANENFNTFLRSTPQQVEVEVDMGEELEPLPEQQEEEVDVDDLFASRL